jgi:hypothetical protein
VILHGLEAQRLHRHLAVLRETLPQRADALQVVQLRCEWLQRQRATLGAKGLQELGRLLEELPAAYAKLHAERIEHQELPKQIARHQDASERWRRRAAHEV